MSALRDLEECLAFAADCGDAGSTDAAQAALANVRELVADLWNTVATARHTGEPIDPERIAAALEPFK
jgi:hypothetical protein